MDEHDFRLLDTLYETRNITKTADKLYTTQSSVSKRVMQMERDLGAKLMLRSRKGIHFTAEGETVLSYIRDVRRRLGDMRQELRQSQGDVAGTLRAGVSINYVRYRLTPTLLSYRKKYPLVKTRISAGSSRSIFGDLMSNRIDVAILRGEFPWKGDQILLERENLCLIVGEENSGQPIEELPQVLHSETDMEWEISQWMRENHLTRHKNTITVNNVALCMEAVRNGLGWGIVPEICLNDFKGVIRPLYFSNGEPLQRSTYLMYPRPVLELPQTKAFIDMIRAYHEEKRGHV